MNLMHCGKHGTKQIRVSLMDSKNVIGKLPFWAAVPDGDSPSRQEGACPWFEIVSKLISAETQIKLLKSKRYRFWIKKCFGTSIT